MWPFHVLSVNLLLCFLFCGLEDTGSTWNRSGNGFLWKSSIFLILHSAVHRFTSWVSLQQQRIVCALTWIPFQRKSNDEHWAYMFVYYKFLVLYHFIMVVRNVFNQRLKLYWLSSFLVLFLSLENTEPVLYLWHSNGWIAGSQTELGGHFDLFAECWLAAGTHSRRQIETG